MVKKLLAEEIAERGATVMISSHNLRELEDLCDQVGLLSAGRLLFEKDLDVLKLGFCRVQAAYDHPVDWAATGLAILDKKERGKLVSLPGAGHRGGYLGRIGGAAATFCGGAP